jgi:hypothetical protein
MPVEPESDDEGALASAVIEPGAAYEPEPAPVPVEPEADDEGAFASVVIEPEPRREPALVAAAIEPEVEREPATGDAAAEGRELEAVVTAPAPSSRRPVDGAEPIVALSYWLDEEDEHRSNGSGTVSTFVRADPGDAPFEITLYLHPGRARLGLLGLERVRAQFDLAGARVFESLGQAELAADDLVGFLAEVRGGFIDSTGRRCDNGVFYLPRLKP